MNLLLRVAVSGVISRFQTANERQRKRDPGAERPSFAVLGLEPITSLTSGNKAGNGLKAKSSKGFVKMGKVKLGFNDTFKTFLNAISPFFLLSWDCS